MTTSQWHTHDLKVIAERIAEKIEKGEIKNKQDLLRYKKFFSKEYGLDRIPSDTELLASIDEESRESILGILQRKPVRTISGVAVVAVMSSPHPCPHGRCVPCPGGPPYSPQSYTGMEPAARRAERNNFDPYLQVRDRIKQLEIIGHPTDKIDMIIMGGTFPARDLHYQEWFVKRCYDALNEKNARNLEEAKRINEGAKHRCIGLTVETRPDWCRLIHVEKMLEMGATRVEIGAQILDDEILYIMKRGHTVSDTIMATQIARDAGLKICYHIMPGLPGSNYERDMESFKRMFTDERFRPDMLKIYPTLVVKPSALYEMWKQGRYRPLDEDEAVELIAEMKEYVPEWVRIQRIERDIPSNLIEAGIKKSNLRQVVQEKMRKEGKKCRCIRCREVGHLGMEVGDDFILRRREYVANGGREIFLSFESRDAIAAYCRLRIPYRPYFFDDDCAIVRELKVHGPMVEIGKRKEERWQHRGYGKMLMDEAEKQARRFGKGRLLVLSGVGVRSYYRKMGYEKQGFYMAKVLD